jgi:hypothetical protein
VETREQKPPSGSSGNGGGHGLGERLDQAGHAAGAGWSRARDTYTDLRDTVDLDGHVRRHPYGTLAAAVGIGYLLGGGLFTPLTGRIVGLGLRVGLRLAVWPMLKDQLGDLVDVLGRNEAAADEAQGTPAESPERK